MSDISPYWEKATARGAAHVAQELGPRLAALRRGLGREAGTVPQMWPFYRTLEADGRLTNRLRAEHATLALFGLHQQGQQAAVHVADRRIGESLGDLRRSGRYSENALDARFTQAATADDPVEVTYHLRGLVQQLKVAHVRGFDYTDLFRTLDAWAYPERRGRSRRRWAADYYRRGAATTDDRKDT
jgi:CRISPR system Cascade subunit CasB